MKRNSDYQVKSNGSPVIWQQQLRKIWPEEGFYVCLSFHFRGADINAQNNRGDTPLHISAYRGFLDIIKYLVRAGANALLRNEKDKTAQEEAASGGHVQTANFLLSVMEGTL